MRPVGPPSKIVALKAGDPREDAEKPNEALYDGLVTGTATSAGEWQGRCQVLNVRKMLVREAAPTAVYVSSGIATVRRPQLQVSNWPRWHGPRAGGRLCLRQLSRP